MRAPSAEQRSVIDPLPVLTGTADLQTSHLLKDPYVLQSLGLEERASYSESKLEAAIVDHVERFLLELGKRFLCDARQNCRDSVATISATGNVAATAPCAKAFCGQSPARSPL